MRQITGRQLDRQAKPDAFRVLRAGIGTQVAVSAMLGVSRKSLACWETGFHPIPRMAVMALLYLKAVSAELAGPRGRTT